MKNLRFSSQLRAKVGHQGPPGSARAQPCLIAQVVQKLLQRKDLILKHDKDSTKLTKAGASLKKLLQV